MNLFNFSLLNFTWVIVQDLVSPYLYAFVSPKLIEFIVGSLFQQLPNAVLVYKCIMISRVLIMNFFISRLQIRNSTSIVLSLSSSSSLVYNVIVLSPPCSYSYLFM